MKWGFQGSIAFFSSSLQMISEGKSVQSFQVWQLNQKTEVFATGSSLNPIQGSGNHLVPTFPRLGKVSRRGGMKEEPAETRLKRIFLRKESFTGRMSIGMFQSSRCLEKRQNEWQGVSK